MNEKITVNGANGPLTEASFSVGETEDGNIRLVQEMAGRITEEIVHIKSRLVRRQLIAMGWTPPEGVDMNAHDDAESSPD